MQQGSFMCAGVRPLEPSHVHLSYHLDLVGVTINFSVAKVRRGSCLDSAWRVFGASSVHFLL